MCFGELGCLEISERWYDLYRPVNLLPLDRDVINTQFMLRTREDRQVGLNMFNKQYLFFFFKERFVTIGDKIDVQESGFDGSKPTKIIIHGFIDTGFEIWVKVGRIFVSLCDAQHFFSSGHEQCFPGPGRCECDLS